MRRPEVTVLAAERGWNCLLVWVLPDGRRGFLRQPVIAWLVSIEHEVGEAFADLKPITAFTPPAEWVVEAPDGAVTEAEAIFPSAAAWAQERGLAPDAMVPSEEAVLCPGGAA